MLMSIILNTPHNTLFKCLSRAVEFFTLQFSLRGHRHITEFIHEPNTKGGGHNGTTQMTMSMQITRWKRSLARYRVWFTLPWRLITSDNWQWVWLYENLLLQSWPNVSTSHQWDMQWCSVFPDLDGNEDNPINILAAAWLTSYPSWVSMCMVSGFHWTRG